MYDWFAITPSSLVARAARIGGGGALPQEGDDRPIASPTSKHEWAEKPYEPGGESKERAEGKCRTGAEPDAGKPQACGRRQRRDRGAEDDLRECPDADPGSRSRQEFRITAAQSFAATGHLVEQADRAQAQKAE